jgi:hypothetical protein
MRRFLFCSVVVLMATLAVRAHVVGAQGLAGLQANWKDLETWSHAMPDAGETELGLGLQPPGSSGVLMAFLGTRDLRNPRKAPATVRVQVATSPVASSTLVRRPTLVFIADPGTERRVALDLTPLLTVDDPTPGGNIQNGVASMPAADFVRLANARAVAASVFGFDVTLRADQIEAMHAFAARLGLR